MTTSESVQTFDVATFRGDGIGRDVVDAAIEVLGCCSGVHPGARLRFVELEAGAGYFKKTGRDIADGAMDAAAEADAILLGAIGLPDVRHEDGTEISPHLRMRDRFGLYAGVRPVKAYANTPRRLSDERSALIDLVVMRESTEGLFYSHGRGEVTDDREARETLLITRATTEKLCDAAFALARRRKERAAGDAKQRRGKVTCVDKANVFRAFAFFRKIFDERAARFPGVDKGYNYIDAQALDLIRRPWEFDVLVMENMFGDIISDLAGGLVGGMGMASCAELGDEHGLFQPAHGSAPDITGKDAANPLAAILSAGLMLDWLGQRHGQGGLCEAADLISGAVEQGFEQGRLRPMEFGGDQGTRAVTATVCELVSERLAG